MDWQEISALAVVGVTAGVFAWAKLRSRKPGSHCSAECGCSPGKEPAAGSITYRTRKGEPPSIIVKFK